MFFYLKNIHLCTSWLKWCFLHWKIFKTSVIYIYHCAIIHLCDFFSWIIYTSIRLYTYVILFTWSIYTHLFNYGPLWFFNLKYIHLCAIIHLKYITSVQLCTSVIFSIKYTHFFAILHLCDFFLWSIKTSVRLPTSVNFLHFRNFQSIFSTIDMLFSNKRM